MLKAKIAGIRVPSLNESPSEKEGKFEDLFFFFVGEACLNESPSEKEGKSDTGKAARYTPITASMKVPPKRKGNPSSGVPPMMRARPQ